MKKQRRAENAYAAELRACVTGTLGFILELLNHPISGVWVTGLLVFDWVNVPLYFSVRVQKSNQIKLVIWSVIWPVEPEIIHRVILCQIENTCCCFFKHFSGPVLSSRWAKSALLLPTQFPPMLEPRWINPACFFFKGLQRRLWLKYCVEHRVTG